MSLRAFMERHSAELEGVALARGLPADFFVGERSAGVGLGELEGCYADLAALVMRDELLGEQERPQLLAALSRWMWERAGAWGVSAERLSAWMHDLRTPLVPLNYIHMALSGDFGPLNAEQRRRLGVAARNARTLEDQIGVFQAFLHMQRGGIEPRSQEVLVPELLERAGSFYGELAARAGVGWSLRAPSGGAVRGDTELLVRALRALLDNALRACSEGGGVCLGAEPQGEAVVCFVEDTGCGMDEDALSRWWWPFERGFSGRGLGLGLTVARGIVEAHGATLRVRSGPGQGTRVSFELPAVGP